MSNPEKLKWWAELRRLRKDIQELHIVIPQVLRLERDLAVALGSERRLIGENDDLRAKNLELRRQLLLERAVNERRRSEKPNRGGGVVPVGTGRTQSGEKEGS